MCLFAVGKNYLAYEISRSECTIYGLKFGVGEIIWGLIFLVYHCPSHFLNISSFGTGQLTI